MRCSRSRVKHLFREAQRSLAYLDLDIDVSAGGPAKRFLLRPAATAKMLQAAEISETDNVLVVGCASGYLAALASRSGRSSHGDRMRFLARGKGRGGSGRARSRKRDGEARAGG